MFSALIDSVNKTASTSALLTYAERLYQTFMRVQVAFTTLESNIRFVEANDTQWTAKTKQKK